MFAAPPTVVAEIFAKVPPELDRKGDATLFKKTHGYAVPGSFLEGPCFDKQGNLYVVDVLWGRIFKVSPDGTFAVVVEYDGEPAGLALHPDGRLFIADFKNGIMAFDPASGIVEPILERVASERFKGCNDLVFSSTGDLYFTDQGVTGLHDPTGRLYRLSASGQLRCLLNNVPSPNGLVLNPAERILYLAVTRANAVWRVPLQDDGSTVKVGVFVQLSGGAAGPDGMAMDSKGGLTVAHAGLGTLWYFDAKGEPRLRINSPAGDLTTNAAYHPTRRRELYVTESGTGTILRCEMPEDGLPLHGETGGAR